MEGAVNLCNCAVVEGIVQLCSDLSSCRGSCAAVGEVVGLWREL